MCDEKTARPPPYLDIQKFFEKLGRLWIISTATTSTQQMTTCKVYDVTAVTYANVTFKRIFYKNGERKEMLLHGRLNPFEHPVLLELMKYKFFMKVETPGETPFFEYLLHETSNPSCGVFLVTSGNVKFYELRLWNSSAVSAYSECLRHYVSRIPHGNYITTYYNGQCPKIFNQPQ
ncbi:uncharacterized protein LOC142586891 [Dermacentor variabilis]|uniref:uncharacterized protein LOC142586891 n=1 Tax=Dermacentor variabilis TaxID=34621 RepID=UPI003F5BDC6B